ncbi:hypothetical protein AKJ37_05835 [candidate division MSBL1 archaeon SCGC-AAA259I09]|uniref:Uncharacterized protein n=1 Tax=candidate division MSBL1 archaeon SCGC-AAA259I09 TaxID=1698267 RepID=A0A133UPV3_9EURY|nr:hypothetical protein AKJ37_05835 [candidate division MSBL1 archaeon SCGC-AAA259I09]
MVGIAGTLGAIASLLLIFLLSGKEIADAGESGLSKVLGRNLNVAIIPLLITFTFIVLVNVVQVI